MRLQPKQLSQLNWFYITLLAFVIVLPLSQALVSIISGVLLLVALVEDSIHNKLYRLKQRKILLLIPIVFVIYLLSTLLTINGEKPFWDLQRAVFYLIFPLAFALGKEITSNQKRVILQTFTVSVFVATLITIVNWRLSPNNTNFSIHNASLVSHIRFSFQLILVFWFLLASVFYNAKYFGTKKIVFYLILAFYFLSFIFFQQSITGIISLYGSIMFVLFYSAIKASKPNKLRLTVLGCIVLLVPVIYLGYVIHTFYDIEEVTSASVAEVTNEGNAYQHNLERKEVENGRYVYLHICEVEMRREWNNISEIKYDSLGGNGYPIYDTLMRYLTSKGVRKDAEGVKTLSANDVRNIEGGIANIIFTRKFSIYPRLYQTVWEYYNYSTSGYVNHQSFAQRIEFAKAAVTIIRNNKWFGVGTGHWSTEFANAFKTNNSKLDESLFSSSHNQYLNFIVKFGLIGFMVIMLLLIYPVVSTKRYKDLLFLILLVFMFIANFGDSNLETHMGASFFLFFYCFFIVTNGTSYLKIRN